MPDGAEVFIGGSFIYGCTYCGKYPNVYVFVKYLEEWDRVPNALEVGWKLYPAADFLPLITASSVVLKY